MKNPHRASEGAGKTQRAADKNSLPEAPCPNAQNCRSITPSTHTDSAACNFCRQHLDRTDLLELYFGIWS